MKNLIFVILFSQTAFAGEEWFCTTQSSKVEGNTFYSCGVGEGFKENVARDEAMKAAINQFKALCEISTKCREMRIAIEPDRMSCEQGDAPTNSLIYKYQRPWKCHKLVLFRMET